MSKNSSSGSASNSTPARNPPSSAPTTPMIAVTMIPPGSSPGSRALAIAPAISPRMMNAMIPIDPPSDSLRTTPCGFAAAGLSRAERLANGLVAAGAGDGPTLHVLPVDDEQHRRADDGDEEAARRVARVAGVGEADRDR